MSPVTHFLASWVVASLPRLSRRDIALVTFAGVAPDIDGLGAIPELLTRNSARPLDWFTQYHHVLAHNLPFAVGVAAVIFAVSQRRWLAACLAFTAIHLHFLMDVLGSRGPDGYNWSIPYLEPFTSRVQLSWSGQWVLNSWQNIAITCGLLLVVLVRSIQIGRSPVEMFSPCADERVIAALRQRWSETRTNAAGNRN